LHAKKGMVLDWRGKGSSLQEKKRLNQYEQLKGVHEHEMKKTKTYSQPKTFLTLFLGGESRSKE
jgi:hypothetical protein